jgi:peptidylprolyl isomerase
MALKKIRGMIFLACLVGCTKPVLLPKTDVETISYHRGYTFWQDHLEFAKMPYDIEQVIEGLRAADRGEKLLIDEEQLAAVIRRFQEEFFAKKMSQNLEEAEAYLQKIATDSIELIPSRLYYKINRKGEGEAVGYSDTPLFTYSAKTIIAGQETLIFSTESEGIPISLADTIPGFSQGVVGMLVGESRVLFIHPDLAHGAYTHIPNQLIIMEVEVISINEETK